MKPEIKEKWLKALRSGEYKQGQENLHPKDGSFCCLGVLTDIYIKEIGRDWEEDSSCYVFNGCGGLLPSEVMKWAGLESEEAWDNTLRMSDEEYNSLSVMNDSGRTFEEIAEVIEREL
jgi:hypothetical protein